MSVAVLLDNFMNYTIRIEEEDQRRERAEQRNRSEVWRGWGAKERKLNMIGKESRGKGGGRKGRQSGEDHLTMWRGWGTTSTYEPVQQHVWVLSGQVLGERLDALPDALNA